jgi:hypothetical protein
VVEAEALASRSAANQGDLITHQEPFPAGATTPRLACNSANWHHRRQRAPPKPPIRPLTAADCVRIQRARPPRLGRAYISRGEPGARQRQTVPERRGSRCCGGNTWLTDDSGREQQRAVKIRPSARECGLAAGMAMPAELSESQSRAMRAHEIESRGGRQRLLSHAGVSERR